MQWDCPKEKIIILINAEFNSDEEEKDNDMPPHEDANVVDDDLKEVKYKDFLVTRCTLSS